MPLGGCAYIPVECRVHIPIYSSPPERKMHVQGNPIAAAHQLCAHLGIGADNELERLRMENAELTDKVEKLEVAVGDLLKEIRFLKNITRAALK